MPTPPSPQCPRPARIPQAAGRQPSPPPSPLPSEGSRTLLMALAATALLLGVDDEGGDSILQSITAPQQQQPPAKKVSASVEAAAAAAAVAAAAKKDAAATKCRAAAAEWCGKLAPALDHEMAWVEPLAVAAVAELLAAGSTGAAVVRRLAFVRPLHVPFASALALRQLLIAADTARPAELPQDRAVVATGAAAEDLLMASAMTFAAGSGEAVVGINNASLAGLAAWAFAAARVATVGVLQLGGPCGRQALLPQPQQPLPQHLPPPAASPPPASDAGAGNEASTFVLVGPAWEEPPAAAARAAGMVGRAAAEAAAEADEDEMALAALDTVVAAGLITVTPLTASAGGGVMEPEGSAENAVLRSLLAPLLALPSERGQFAAVIELPFDVGAGGRSSAHVACRVTVNRTCNHFYLSAVPLDSASGGLSGGDPGSGSDGGAATASGGGVNGTKAAALPLLLPQQLQSILHTRISLDDVPALLSFNWTEEAERARQAAAVHAVAAAGATGAATFPSIPTSVATPAAAAAATVVPAVDVAPAMAPGVCGGSVAAPIGTLARMKAGMTAAMHTTKLKASEKGAVAEGEYHIAVAAPAATTAPAAPGSDEKPLPLTREQQLRRRPVFKRDSEVFAALVDMLILTTTPARVPPASDGCACHWSTSPADAVASAATATASMGPAGGGGTGSRGGRSGGTVVLACRHQTVELCSVWDFACGGRPVRLTVSEERRGCFLCQARLVTADAASFTSVSTTSAAAAATAAAGAASGVLIAETNVPPAVAAELLKTAHVAASSSAFFAERTTHLEGASRVDPAVVAQLILDRLSLCKDGGNGGNGGGGGDGGSDIWKLCLGKDLAGRVEFGARASFGRGSGSATSAGDVFVRRFVRGTPDSESATKCDNGNGTAAHVGMEFRVGAMAKPPLQLQQSPLQPPSPLRVLEIFSRQRALMLEVPPGLCPSPVPSASSASTSTMDCEASALAPFRIRGGKWARRLLWRLRRSVDGAAVHLDLRDPAISVTHVPIPITVSRGYFASNISGCGCGGNCGGSNGGGSSGGSRGAGNCHVSADIHLISGSTESREQRGLPTTPATMALSAVASVANRTAPRTATGEAIHPASPEIAVVLYGSDFVSVFWLPGAGAGAAIARMLAANIMASARLPANMDDAV
ncbi:unnamed protein product, partial [Phaeothamnion confervicola]